MLYNYKKNIYSQNGEDGILLEILKRVKFLKNKNKWCCEFGAWDGIKGSNTFNLVKNLKFNAVYIEGDKKKFKKLVKNSNKFSKIIPINKYISHKKNSKFTLDKVLKKTNIPKKFEILSIDIDSYDLSVWESLKNYKPEIVIIEINSGIKPGIFQKNSLKNKGNSFTSTLKVGLRKGYRLVCHTGNCIFVKKELIKKIALNKKYLNNPNLLFDYTWLEKKESRLKKILKTILPSFVLDFLRNLK